MDKAWIFVLGERERGMGGDGGLKENIKRKIN